MRATRRKSAPSTLLDPTPSTAPMDFQSASLRVFRSKRLWSDFRLLLRSTSTANPAAVRVRLREFISEREDEIRGMEEREGGESEGGGGSGRAARRGSGNLLSWMFTGSDPDGSEYDDDDDGDAACWASRETFLGRMLSRRTCDDSGRGDDRSASTRGSARGDSQLDRSFLGRFVVGLPESEGGEAEAATAFALAAPAGGSDGEWRGPDRRPPRAGFFGSAASLPSLGRASSDGSVSDFAAGAKGGPGSGASLSSLSGEIVDAETEQRRSVRLGGRRKSVEGPPPGLLGDPDSLFEEFYSSQLKRVHITSGDEKVLNFDKVDSSSDEESDGDTDDDRSNNGSFEFPGRRIFVRKNSDPDLEGPKLNAMDVSERTCTTLNESVLPSNRNKYRASKRSAGREGGSRHSDPNLTSGLDASELSLPLCGGSRRNRYRDAREESQRCSVRSLSSGFDVSTLLLNDSRLQTSQVEEAASSYPDDQECKSDLAFLCAKTLSLQMMEERRDDPRQDPKSSFYDVLKKTAPRPVQRRLSQKQPQQSSGKEKPTSSKSSESPSKIDLEIDWQDFKEPTVFREKRGTEVTVAQDDTSGCFSEASDVAVLLEL